MIAMNLQRLSHEIDATLNHPERYSSILISPHTPEILQQVGLEDLPILMSQNHVRNCLYQKDFSNPHFHGLTKQHLLEIPSQLANPAIIMDSLTDNKSILVVTNLTDADLFPIVVVLRVNGSGTYESNCYDSNYLTSTYGRASFQNFFERAAYQDKILYINKKRTQALEQCAQLQLLRAYSSILEFDAIIKQSFSARQAYNFNSYIYKAFLLDNVDDKKLASYELIVGVDNNSHNFIVYNARKKDEPKLYEVPFSRIHDINNHVETSLNYQLVSPGKYYVQNSMEDFVNYCQNKLPSKLAISSNLKDILNQIWCVEHLGVSKYFPAITKTTLLQKFFEIKQAVLLAQDSPCADETIQNTQINPSMHTPAARYFPTNSNPDLSL